MNRVMADFVWIGLQDPGVEELLLESSRQTVVQRKCAAWAAILAFPTAIAGIYGMNFSRKHGPFSPSGRFRADGSARVRS